MQSWRNRYMTISMNRTGEAESTKSGGAIADALTLVRLILTPVIMFVIIKGWPNLDMAVLATVLLIIAAATDFFDDYFGGTENAPHRKFGWFDDIADIMINGPDTTYIEVGGRIEKASIKFRDNQHLTTICQRIVGAIGRRVDEASPICDARLPDGSRVNVIIPPLAVDGACMTIRKFTKDKLTLEKLLEYQIN